MKSNLKEGLPKKIITIFLLALITATGMTSLFISTPGIEKIFPQQKYDLFNYKAYVKNTYTIETTENDSIKLADGQKVLFTRLKKIGAYDFSISDYTTELATSTESATSTKFTVTVVSKENIPSIETLLSSQNIIQIMTRKADVNFDDTENPYASYFSTNYDPTDYDQTFFRAIAVKRLKNADGDYSYFAIPKTWPKETEVFEDFLLVHAGETIGILIDGMVQSYTIPEKSQSQSKEIIFGLSNDAQQAKLAEIVFNSGTIEYISSVIDTKEETYENGLMNYLLIGGFTVIAGIAAAIVLYFREHDLKKPFMFILTNGLIITLWISWYKLTTIPIDLMMLLPGVYFVFMLSLAGLLFEKYFKRILAIAIVTNVITIATAVGFSVFLAQELLILTFCVALMLPISEFYVNSVRKYLLK